LSVAGSRKEQYAGLFARPDVLLARARLASGGAFASLVFPHDKFEICWTPLAKLGADSAAWHDLAARTLEPNVFLEPAFARAAADHFGPSDLGALAVYAEERLVGLLPGRVEGISAGRPVPVFVAWTHPFAPLSTPLIDREIAGEAVVAMLESLPKLPGAPKAALFPLLPEASVTARLIALHIGVKGQSVTRYDTHVRAALMPEQGEASAMVSARKRKELRRQRRRLAESGVLVHETALAANEVSKAVADFIAVEANSWKGRAGGAVSRDPNAAAFLAEAVTALAGEHKARVDRLTLDGATIAATITLFSGDYAWFWKIGYDETYARYSPGVQIAHDLTMALEEDESLSLVDSCAVADHPMIDHLWSGRIAIADWLVPLDGSMSFAVTAAGERARRAIIAPLKALRNRLRR
jgi:CelD/BcsL family acetyltransferase involved in cellulose biosynthesis